MYPKWLVFVLTLLSCMVLMASAIPLPDADSAPAKRLKQFELRRPAAEDVAVARRGTAVERAKRSGPSRRSTPIEPAKRSGPSRRSTPIEPAKRGTPSRGPHK